MRTEKEHEGPVWKHPYLAYVILTLVLFFGMLIAAWVAWTQGWIPNRGIG